MPLAADLSLNTLASSVARSMVKGVTFRSQVTPDYSYDPWAPVPEQPPGGGGSWLMDLVRPEVTIDTGEAPLVFAPYGTPSENYVPHAGLAVLGVVLAIFYLGRLTK